MRMLFLSQEGDVIVVAVTESYNIMEMNCYMAE
jgi:hypothetical protein